MSEKQSVDAAADPGNIMQGIQDMIGDLLKNAVDKVQQTEINKKLGHKPTDSGEHHQLQPQMGLAEVKGFVDVMQKFIDNVNVVIAQLETGDSNAGDTDDKFLEGYMATADNVLEIAAFSLKDPLTGLSNRYGFDNRLILEWNRATRDKTALSLVIFGVEGFNKSGDDKKHDELLKTISETLESTIKRTTDFIARWSDNEFAVLLPITGADGATIVTQRLQNEINNMSFPGITEDSDKPAVSIGVCSHTPVHQEKPVDFISKAHDAYNKAKASGVSSIIIA